MTNAEVMRMLETFRARYTPDVDSVAPETVALWVEQFRATHRDDMRTAAKAYLADHPPSEPFPKPAGLRWYLRTASEPAEATTGASQSKPRGQRRIETQEGPCLLCDRGWKESKIVETATTSEGTTTYPPAVYPCPACNPTQYDRWHDQWFPEATRMRPVKSTDLFTFNPSEMIAQARSLANVTKDTNQL